jgi:autotransporter-associated beta strand protein
MNTKFSADLGCFRWLAICAAIGIFMGFPLAQAQPITTIVPSGWIQDPFSAHNADFGVINPNTSYPTFTNNGAGLGNLNGYSPFGQTLTLTGPGQSVIMSGQAIPFGNINTLGNVQFRFGLLYKGANGGDTGWAGTLIANATGGGGSGLYLENIPNSSVFANGGASTIPTLAGTTFNAGWGAGTYNYTLSVTYLTASSEMISWSIQGVSPSVYLFSGRYTNTTAASKVGFNFDSIGFLCGGSTWTYGSTANGLTITNDQVVFGNFGDGAWTSAASGLWSAAGNWNNAAVANGSGFIADFSQVALTADTTVTLDSSRSIGSLYFGASGGSTKNWFVASSGGSSLSLNNNGLNIAPVIAVNQNTATLNVALNSTNGLAEVGAGTLVLGGNNTISGPLNLNGGELSFASFANLPLTGSGITAINFGGGGLQWAPGNTLDISAPGIPVSFAGNATLDVGANNVNLANGFGDSGAGGLTKLGAGTLTFSGSVAYAGTTAIKGGTLALGGSGSISSSTNIVVLAGATFNVSALSGGLTLNNQNLSGTGTVAGNISDSSGVTTASGYAATGAAGTLTINGNLSLNGGGLLAYGLANVTTAGAGVNDLIAVTGKLTIAGPTTINVTLLNGAPGLGSYTLFTYGTIAAGSAANLIPPLGYNVVDTGSSIQLVVTHIPSSLTWQGDNSLNVWDTATTANWTNSAGASVDFFTGDSVTFNNTGSASPAISLSGNLSPSSVVVNSTLNYDFAGAGAMVTGSLTKSGTGVLTLENNNSYNGPTVINGGILQVGGGVNGGTSGALGTGAVTNNSALVFNLAQSYAVATNIYGTGNITNLGSAGTVTLSGNVSGGAITMSGSGALVLSGSNSYTGQTIVTSGSLHPENNHALGAGAAGAIVSSGAQLYFDNGGTITNKPISLAGTGVAGDGALRAGGGKVTTIAGAISLTADTQFQVDGGATLNLAYAAGISAPGINVTLGADSGGAGNFTGPLSLGAGSLTVQDAGTWTLAPSNNFTGLTSVNGGTLIVTGTNELGPIASFNPAYVTLGGGIIGATNNVTFADGLRGFTISGTAGGFDVAAGATLTISNQISGSGTLTKSDSGTLVLSASNSFSGTLNVDTGNNVNNDGVLAITSSNAIVNALSPIALRNILGGSSTFELNGAGGNITVAQDFTISGRSPVTPDILSAAGTNTMSGNFTGTGGGGSSRYIFECDSGLLTLGSPSTTLTFTTTDPQTFSFQGNGSFSVAGVIADGTAATSISKSGSGTLTLDAANTYTGATTVTGGTLAGIGVIAGPVSVGAGGTLAPGSTGAPLGTLTVNNSLTLAGNTLVSVSGPSASSQIAGLTGATYGGTLTVNNLGGALSAGNNFQIFPAATFSGNFTSIAPAPGAGLAWNFNPTNGLLSVVTGVALNSTNISFSVSNNTLKLSWPADHQGWILQTQTNNLSHGLATNWVDVAGSGSITQTNINIIPSNPTMFFRLRSP